MKCEEQTHKFLIKNLKEWVNTFIYLFSPSNDPQFTQSRINLLKTTAVMKYQKYYVRKLST